MTEPATLQPVAKPRSVRRLGPVDVAPLRAQVARLSRKAWNRENAGKENDFSCFAHTRHIVFRFVLPAGIGFYVRPSWNLWRRWLLPVMAQAAAPYGFSRPVYPKAMLARLAAGRGIEPHVDHGKMNPLAHKVHVPLRTNPHATLTSAGTAFHLAAGYAWEVNNLALHGAFNGGGQDRIHFIFEVLEGAGMDWRPQQREERAPAAGGRTYRLAAGPIAAPSACAVAVAPPPTPDRPG